MNLETLEPLLAGYIVDGKIGYKEIVATIIDLVVNGYLNYVKDSNGVEWFLRTKKKANTLPLYKFLILKGIGKKTKLKNALINIDLKAVELNDAIKSRINDKDVKVGIVKRKKRGLRHQFVSNIISLFMLVGFTVISLLFMSLFGGFVGELGFIFFILFIIIVSVTFALGIWDRGLLDIEKMLGMWKDYVYSQNVRQRTLKKRYRTLYKYIKKYPLKTSELFSEYLPYAIAFEIDTKWIKKMNAKAEDKTILMLGSYPIFLPKTKKELIYRLMLVVLFFIFLIILLIIKFLFSFILLVFISLLLFVLVGLYLLAHYNKGKV